MMNAEDKVRTMISKNMRILKFFGYIFEENETLNEYRIKIEENNEITEPLKFFSLYEALLYSHYEVCADDVEAVEHDYLLLKNALKTKGFKYRFYIV